MDTVKSLLEMNKINEELRFPFDRLLDNFFQGKYLVDATFSFSKTSLFFPEDGI